MNLRHFVFLASLLCAVPFVAADDAIVAFVGNQVVLHSDIERTMKDRGFDAQNALQEQINTRLLLIEAETQKVTVTRADVTAEIARYHKNFPDEKTFREHLAAQTLSMDTLRRIMEEQLKIRRFLQGTVFQTISISTTEIARECRELEKEVEPEFLLKAKDFPDKESAAEFAKKWTAESAGGMDELGWMKKSEILPAVAASLANLKTGVPSEPILVTTRWHIFLVQEERNHQTPNTVNTQSARERIFERKYEEKMRDLLTKLRDRIPITILQTE